ncbi:MAG TPA: D-hexose-6-phosphate mutarotase [Gammaproteobacteria bacterium]|jgi:glucose-6-phosphate 1-epimerase|nr:D-hexose-6-phosphate mutarotase [Gammaproteobacteria bacterium]
MSMQNSAALNARYGIPEQLSFKDTASGLIVAEVNNAHAMASIALQGAHLMTWAPKGELPVIWLSEDAKLAPGKSIRGGVPICWPWFGPHASEPKFPGHGFARTVPWQIIDTQKLGNGATRLVFRIEQSDATRAQWPHASELEIHFVVGPTLEIDLVTRNTGTDAITVGDALHTYFEVGDVSQAKIHGLDGCPYIDKVDGGARKQQAGPVTIASEVDRIYLDSTADCVIDDPVLGRRIRIAKKGSASSVVWNPWIDKAEKMGDLGEDGYLKMLCVESTNADADVVNVAPGAEHHLWVRYSVEALG